MNTKIKTITIIIIIALFVLSACATKTPQPVTVKNTPDTPEIANPAAANCVDKGYQSEIRTAADGSQSGVCVFPDKSECDDWAFFRGECAPGSSQPSGSLDTMLSQDDPAYVADEAQTKAVEIVRTKLAAELKVDPSSLSLVAVEPIDWTDACLQAPEEGETCVPVETPGFRITFSAGDKNYTYHTDKAAGIIRLETEVSQVS